MKITYTMKRRALPASNRYNALRKERKHGEVTFPTTAWNGATIAEQLLVVVGIVDTINRNDPGWVVEDVKTPEPENN